MNEDMGRGKGISKREKIPIRKKKQNHKKKKGSRRIKKKEEFSSFFLLFFVFDNQKRIQNLKF